MERNGGPAALGPSLVLEVLLMFKRFREAAISYGFSPLLEDESCLERGSGFLRHSVTVYRDGGSKAEIFLRLYIDMKDRFEDPPTHHIALSADLHPDHVAILFYGDSRIWKEEEEDVAISAFLKFGLPWFESFSKPEVLIERFERELRDGARPEVNPAAVLWERYLLRREPPKKARRPPINHYYLGLLYDEVGDRERACFHCKENLASVSKGQHEALIRQRERALKQMHDMGCES
jgi:hypothetical protein